MPNVGNGSVGVNSVRTDGSGLMMWGCADGVVRLWDMRQKVSKLKGKVFGKGLIFFFFLL